MPRRRKTASNNKKIENTKLHDRDQINYGQNGAKQEQNINKVVQYVHKIDLDFKKLGKILHNA